MAVLTIHNYLDNVDSFVKNVANSRESYYMFFGKPTFWTRIDNALVYSSNTAAFIIGEVVQQSNGSAIIANGTITSIITSTNTMSVQTIFGNFVSTYQIEGINSTANAVLISATPSVLNDDTQILTANDSVAQHESSIYTDLVFGKKITNDNIAYMIPRNDWANNTVFDRYDQNDGDMYSKQFYVMTDNYEVYKVIDNNSGNPSTIKPSLTTTYGTFSTSDGYIWKYMYSLDSNANTHFTTPSYIPVTPNTQVSNNAVGGTIDAIRIISGGSNYRTYYSGFLTASINNYTVGIDGGAAPANDYYTDSSMYLKAGYGAGQIRKIKKYDGLNRLVTLETPFDTYAVFNLKNVTGSVSVGNILTQNVDSLAIFYQQGAFNVGDTVIQSDTGANGTIITANATVFDVVRNSGSNTFALGAPIYNTIQTGTQKSGAVSVSPFTVINYPNLVYLPYSNRALLHYEPTGATVSINIASNTAAFTVGETIYQRNIGGANNALGVVLTANSTQITATHKHGMFYPTYMPLNITANSGPFTNGELIFQSNGTSNTANGTVVYANSNYILVYTNSGAFVSNSTTKQIKGVISGSNATVSTVGATLNIIGQSSGANAVANTINGQINIGEQISQNNGSTIVATGYVEYYDQLTSTSTGNTVSSTNNYLIGLTAGVVANLVVGMTLTGNQIPTTPPTYITSIVNTTAVAMSANATGATNANTYTFNIGRIYITYNSNSTSNNAAFSNNYQIQGATSLANGYIKTFPLNPGAINAINAGDLVYQANTTVSNAAVGFVQSTNSSGITVSKLAGSWSNNPLYPVKANTYNVGYSPDGKGGSFTAYAMPGIVADKVATLTSITNTDTFTANDTIYQTVNGVVTANGFLNYTTGTSGVVLTVSNSTGTWSNTVPVYSSAIILRISVGSNTAAFTVGDTVYQGNSTTSQAANGVILTANSTVIKVITNVGTFSNNSSYKLISLTTPTTNAIVSNVSIASANVITINQYANSGIFNNGEIVYQSNGSSNTANAVVFSSNSTSITLGSVYGSISSNYQLKGISSTSNVFVNGLITSNTGNSYIYAAIPTAILNYSSTTNTSTTNVGSTYTNTTLTVSSTSAFYAGMTVTGNQIPASTTVTNIINSTAVSLSQAATGNTSSNTYTFFGAFNIGEIIYQSNGSANTANAYVLAVNSSACTISVAINTGVFTTSYQVKGNTSSTNAVLSGVSTIQANLTNDYTVGSFVRIGGNANTNIRRVTAVNTSVISTSTPLNTNYTSNVHYLMPYAVDIAGIALTSANAYISNVNLNSIKLTFNNVATQGLNFVVGEKVDQVDSSNINQGANATVSFANSTTLVLTGVNGTFVGNPSTTNAQTIQISSNNGSFVVGDIISQGNGSVVTANAYVYTANSSTLQVVPINGYFTQTTANMTISGNTIAFNVGETIYQNNGSSTTANGYILTANATVLTVIPNYGVFNNLYQIKGVTSTANAVVGAVVSNYITDQSTKAYAVVSSTSSNASGLFVRGESSYQKASIISVDSYPNITTLVPSGTFISGQLVYAKDSITGTSYASANLITYYTIPNQLTEYVISPTVTITGDGVGAEAYAIVNNSINTTNNIQQIVVLNPGTGYTQANVTVTANGAYGTGAYMAPTISPVLGHGSDTYSELGARYVGITVDVGNSVTESFKFPTYNSYRKIGIIKNPLYNDLTINLNHFDRANLGVANIAGNGFTTGEYVYQYNTGGNTGVIGQITYSNSSYIEVQGVSNTFSSGMKFANGLSTNDNILGLTTGTTANVLTSNVNYFRILSNVEIAHESSNVGTSNATIVQLLSNTQMKLSNVSGSFVNGVVVYDTTTNAYANVVSMYAANNTTDVTTNFGQNFIQTLRFPLTSNTKPFQQYETVTQSLTNASGFLLSSNNEIDIMFTGNTAFFAVGQTIKSQNLYSNGTALVAYTPNSSYMRLTASLNNFQVGDTIINNLGTTATVTNVFSVLVLGNIQGTFQGGPSVTSTVTGSNSMATGSSVIQSGVIYPDLVRNSGTVQYLENITPFTLTNTSTEEVRLIIKF